MLRFCEKGFAKEDSMRVTISDIHIGFDENVWKNGREFFKQNMNDGSADILMVPIEDKKGKIVCYGWQDAEANRELRMIKELERCDDALQFGDVFSYIKEVIVCGCNELAYYFVKYLESQHVKVSVIGKYWNYFGFKSVMDDDMHSENKMIIHAEEFFGCLDLYQKVIRSVSAEFECIDKIYEMNVTHGYVRDTRGVKYLAEKLMGKDIVLLGTGTKAQDTYDLLYGYGIDIAGFIEKENGGGNSNSSRKLFGKKIIRMKEVFSIGDEVVIVDCEGKNSALGTKMVEFFDYFGFERNDKFFLINDYTDIPFSNLIHILKGKKVLLTGDPILCEILSEYLKKIESDNINIRYTELSEWKNLDDDTFCCVVYLWYEDEIGDTSIKYTKFKEKLKSMKSTSYTDYFSCAKTFSIIDEYENGKEKYSIQCLLPKGILIGEIPLLSGNTLFRGLMDGHNNIIMMPYNLFNSNLFTYCIRLALSKYAGKILTTLKAMIEEEIGELSRVFSYWKSFEKSAEKLLLRKEKFTSQELFIIFHIAYAEMLYGAEIDDVSQKVIYWEPHEFPRNEMQFLGKWLESDLINGCTIIMRRNGLVWFGSICNHLRRNGYKEISTNIVIKTIEEEGGECHETQENCYRYWKEIGLRFEDLKMHPREKLLEICEAVGLSWSDTMLQTTEHGKAYVYQGRVKDFDLYPVFNRYEQYLSEFDHFRVAIIIAAYQKKHGYFYENCMEFARTELQEMFLKEFYFQKTLIFENKTDKVRYFLEANEFFTWKLWDVRKHMVLSDIIPVFERLIFEKTEEEKKKAAQELLREEINKVADLIRNKQKLVLYGVGKDLTALWNYLDESVRSRLVFCDRKAENEPYYFYGCPVVGPQELCTKYSDYEILIISSQFYREIYEELDNRGIALNRVFCNTIPLWWGDGK